jgi:hypothetical protein
LVAVAAKADVAEISVARLRNSMVFFMIISSLKVRGGVAAGGETGPAKLAVN